MAIQMCSVCNAQDVTVTANGVRFVMKKVTGGTFIMGSDKDDVWDDEKPSHEVTVGTFYIGETEVTQALWVAVMGYGTAQSETWMTEYGMGKNFPAYNINWQNCQHFIYRLNGITGKRFRLPTEAEWEYAARGGNRSKGYKYSGSNVAKDVAWVYASKSHQVKTKKPNELGIYDMSGNVTEWCSDGYGPYSKAEQTDPKGAENRIYKVYRGGGWNGDEDGCRVTARIYGSQKVSADDMGFRIVLEP